MMKKNLKDDVMLPRTIRIFYLFFVSVGLLVWLFGFRLPWQGKVKVESAGFSRSLGITRGGHNVLQKAAPDFPALGSYVPAYLLTDQKGKTVSQNAFRGSWVLLHFWATWCPPCTKELPLLEALAQKLRGKAVKVLAVSVDTNWQVIQQFLKSKPSLAKRHLGIQLYWDSGAKNAARYGTTKYPETFLIDPSGRLRRKFVGSYPWDSPKMLSTLNRYSSSFARKK